MPFFYFWSGIVEVIEIPKVTQEDRAGSQGLMEFWDKVG